MSSHSSVNWFLLNLYCLQILEFFSIIAFYYFLLFVSYLVVILYLVACIFLIICLLNVSFRSALVSCLNTAFNTTRINIYVFYILRWVMFVCILWKLYHALLLSYFYTKSTQSRMHVKCSIFQTRILYQIFTFGRGQSFNIFLRNTKTGIDYFKFITLFTR